MASFVKPFRNSENFAKCQLFYYEPGCNVIIKAIIWLTGGEAELKERLKEEIKGKSYNKSDKNNLVEYLNGQRKLTTFDLTLYNKLAMTVCGLDDKLVHIKDTLENHLKRLKDGRNEMSHPELKHKNLTDADVEKKYQELKDLLTMILEKAGQKGNVDQMEIQKMKDFVLADLDRIKSNNDVDELLNPPVIDLILNDLKEKYSKFGALFPRRKKRVFDPLLKPMSQQINSQRTEGSSIFYV